jgi:hypothetical protein
LRSRRLAMADDALPTPLTVHTHTVEAGPKERLERAGRWWVFGSFVFCPCHLPLTLGLLAATFGGTTLGVIVRDHAWVAGAILSASWIAGTWYGFRLLHRARSGATCAIKPAPRS